MGLDMWVDSVKKESINDLKDFYVGDEITNTFYTNDGYNRNELFYWRKHHDLHGWFKELYHKKGGKEDFNCVHLLITLEDLEKLEKDVIEYKLPKTEGFFFGDNPPDKRSVEIDLDFIYVARRSIADGNYLFYHAWW